MGIGILGLVDLGVVELIFSIKFIKFGSIGIIKLIVLV
jgi:hypothetical protein